jgi:hypothetical protein
LLECHPAKSDDAVADRRVGGEQVGNRTVAGRQAPFTGVDDAQMRSTTGDASSGAGRGVELFQG